MRNDWYRISNEARVDSPALLVSPDRIDANIRRMVEIAGGPRRLRPHVKTYKMAEVVRAQMAQGIDKFKCAAIAEAEMLAGCDVYDVLFAYQAVRLCTQFSHTGPHVQPGIPVDHLGTSCDFPAGGGTSRTGLKRSDMRTN